VAIDRTLKAGIVGLIPMDSDIWPWEIPGAVTKFVLGNAIVIPILDAITRILTIFFSVMLLVFVVLVIVLGLWLPKIYARLDQRLGGPEPDAGRRVQDYLFFLASLPFLGVFLLGEFDGNERSTLLGVSATVLTLASLIIGITAQLRYRKIAGFGLDRTSRRASVLPWFLGFWGLETSAWFVMTIQGLLASPSWNQP
jgi:hypothetical protein